MKNKKILITGAAGSIGSALSRKIAKLKPKSLIILDQDETGIFDLYEELKEQCRISYIIGNIRDEEAMELAFKTFKPQILYHCAAYKHVVLMEKYPEEAFKTNVLGTKNLVNLANQYDTEKFIFISSDKAVNPKCVMGKTKKEGEIICLQNNLIGSKTKFIIVRFGNVMASRGSVIPIWQKQIEENKNLTITDKRMKRYFMGIYEAVDLILKATELGKGGEIFVLDMGKPIKVLDLANLMIKISGKPLEIEYTKAGQGEKFSEKLMTKEEQKKAKKKGNLWIIK